FYRSLARHLGPDQPFYALQARGLDGKQAGLARVEAMAAHYLEEIRSLQPEGAYALGGFCFGGVVAFEMARRLHAQGQTVALLALIDTLPPDPARRVTETQSLRAHLEHLQCLGPPEKLRYLLTRVKRIYGRVRHPLPAPLRALARGHLQAFSEYTPQAYPGPVTLFRPSQQPARIKKAQLGWGQLALGGLEIHEVSGETDMMFTEPHVRVLADRFRACIERAREDCGR